MELSSPVLKPCDSVHLGFVLFLFIIVKQENTHSTCSKTRKGDEGGLTVSPPQSDKHTVSWHGAYVLFWEL